ncbi:MAG TPA: hypothetical protein VLW85_10650, partial [Myxococcales bacterium]|nr:hypothetical protein [Myxococcales bacterium]
MARPRTAPQIEPAGAPRFVWSHPDAGVRLAAWGEAQQLDDLPQPEAGEWFGALAFAGRLGPDWTGFAPARFALPQRIGPGPAPGPRSLPPPARIVPRPGERESWGERVRRALQAIASGAL